MPLSWTSQRRDLIGFWRLTSRCQRYALLMKLTNECRLCLLQGGPGNADKPFVWLRLEAISNFEDPAKVKSLTPLLYSFMKDELKLEKVKISNLKQKEMLFSGMDYHQFLQAWGYSCGNYGQNYCRIMIWIKDATMQH